jgi:type IV pilus assembly protein PilV
MIEVFRVRERGSTLIEVLITVLIVAMGLLGMSNLQLKSTILSNDSAIRADAANLAHEIADRLYVNALAASAGLYTFALTDSKTASADVDSAAEEDLNRWVDTAANFRGKFAISSLAASAGKPAHYLMRICWPDRLATAPTDCDNEFRYEAARK